MKHIQDNVFIFCFYCFFTLVSFVYVTVLIPETLSFSPNQILQSIQNNAQKIACLRSKNKPGQFAIHQGLGTPINDFVVDYEIQNNEYNNSIASGYTPPTAYGHDRLNPMNQSIDGSRNINGFGGGARSVSHGNDGWKTGGGGGVEMIDSDDFVS